ncbi:MAG: acyltransferase domain-containing protein, partial [Mesorhizobium sp.]
MYPARPVRDRICTRPSSRGQGLRPRDRHGPQHRRIRGGPSCRRVLTRGRLPRNGGMVVLTADPDTAHQMIRDSEVELAIAAENGPASTVVAGETDALETLIKVAKEKGIRTTQLKVSHAFHSHLMDPILEQFQAFASTLDFAKPDGRLVSAKTGKVAGDEVADARYWTDHVRQPVLFHRGIMTAQEIGANLFLEIGPHPVLTPMAQAALDGIA